MKTEAEAALGKPAPNTFQPHKSKRRKPGTGDISQITDHLWNSCCSPIWPDGIKRAHNVCAQTRAACEGLPADPIQHLWLNVQSATNPHFIMAIKFRKYNKTALFLRKRAVIVELLPGFEPGTSSLPIIVDPVLACCFLLSLKP